MQRSCQPHSTPPPPSPGCAWTATRSNISRTSVTGEKPRPMPDQVGVEGYDTYPEAVRLALTWIDLQVASCSFAPQRSLQRMRRCAAAFISLRPIAASSPR